uniref:class I SAM-dependent methyltransferase n=1 Tax=Desertihabitans aurantiacus TaxID=2282477 RepID=UPI0013005935
LAAWAAGRGVRGDGRPAVVVGAGLGADAAFLAGLGFATTAFDVSPSAVAEAGVRLAAAGRDDVTLEVADLLALPERWRGRFDLVVEVFTVQALPRGLREQAVAAVVSLVAPGGTLLVVQGLAPADDDGAGPPWLLTREEMGWFARDGLSVVTSEVLPEGPGWPLQRAELHRPHRSG